MLGPVQCVHETARASAVVRGWRGPARTRPAMKSKRIICLPRLIPSESCFFYVEPGCSWCTLILNRRLNTRPTENSDAATNPAAGPPKGRQAEPDRHPCWLQGAITPKHARLEPGEAWRGYRADLSAGPEIRARCESHRSQSPARSEPSFGRTGFLLFRRYGSSAGTGDSRRLCGTRCRSVRLRPVASA